MNRITLLLAQMLFFSTLALSQDTSYIHVTLWGEYKGNQISWSYRLYEEKAEKLLDTLLQLNGKKKGKKSIHRFRNQQIKGLSKPVTIRIHEGIEQGEDEKHWGFNTFKNQKYRESRIANKQENERLGILVYLIHNSRIKSADVINSDKKSELAIQHLSQFIE